MSKSGQAFVAATQGASFTLYAICKAMGIPLTEEQEKFQAYLERTYPAVVGSLPISALVEPEGFGEREFFAEADNEQANNEIEEEKQ